MGSNHDASVIGRRNMVAFARATASIRNGGHVVPLTHRGRKIKRAMVREYGKKKGEQVFYASERSGRIKGVAQRKRKRK